MLSDRGRTDNDANGYFCYSAAYIFDALFEFFEIVSIEKNTLLRYITVR